MLGLSPLARGTQVVSRIVFTPERFIPARAGNTSPVATRRSASTVHPRSRREHVTSSNSPFRVNGSSPLARGTRSKYLSCILWSRFIPARAGNTEKSCAAPPQTTVHPRSRGEHVCRKPCPTTRPGSSPLARGTRRETHNHKTAKRFIPARAGNTTRLHSQFPQPAVHPRSRGEHDLTWTNTQRECGSSPLARGTL